MGPSDRLSSDCPSEITSVGIALVAHRGCYLVGRRGNNVPLPGYREFPGGKCLPGEPPELCVVRECREETGLEVEVIRLRREIVHKYPYGVVHLFFYDCQIRAGTADQPFPSLEWVPAVCLRELQFPEPNSIVLEELMESDCR